MTFMYGTRTFVRPLVERFALGTRSSGSSDLSSFGALRYNRAGTLRVST